MRTYLREPGPQDHAIREILTRRDPPVKGADRRVRALAGGRAPLPNPSLTRRSRNQSGQEQGSIHRRLDDGNLSVERTHAKQIAGVLSCYDA